MSNDAHNAFAGFSRVGSQSAWGRRAQQSHVPDVGQNSQREEIEQHLLEVEGQVCGCQVVADELLLPLPHMNMPCFQRKEERVLHDSGSFFAKF